MESSSRVLLCRTLPPRRRVSSALECELSLIDRIHCLTLFRARLGHVLLTLIVAISAAAALPGGAHPLGSVSCVVNNTFPFRLPLSAFPSHYDLFMAPNIPGYTSFYGTS